MPVTRIIEVASTYSGILGFLAFLTVVTRSVTRGGSHDAALLHAAMCLAIFAAIGYAAGRIANMIVEDSVRAKLAVEFKEE